MNHPTIHHGTYEHDRRVLEYWTRCEHCAQLDACKKRSAPVEECETPGWMRFFVDGTSTVYWSGIITLRKIASAVREYLECDEDALPDDVSIPARQMRLEEAL